MLAALVAAAAVLVSGGTIGVGTAGGARIGLLPIDAAHLAAAVLIGVGVLALALRRARGRAIAAAVSPLLFVLLPWLPFRPPSPFFVWTGGLATLAWLATVIAVAAVVWPRARRAPAIAPQTHARIAASLSALICASAAWQVSPALPGGDEPHYLVITQSLLRDGDLKIGNNHRRGDYREYFVGDLPPDFIRPGQNGEIYSIHAPGVPALVLPAFALAGYHGVVVFLILVAAMTAGLLWWLAWRVSASASAAWFGWAAVVLSTPWLLETFTVYPDGLGACVALTGFWALLRPDWERVADATSWRPWLLHGLALAALPWMHIRFSVLAATIGGLALIRLTVAPNAVAKAIAFLVTPALSAVAWLWFFLIVYGTPDPTAPYGRQVQNSFAFLPNGLGGLLFDQGFGLLATAPVLVVAFAGLFYVRRLAAQWLIVATPYLIAVTTFAMWWAGWSAPARFFVPVLLPLGIFAAAAWTAMRSRGLRAAALALLVVSVWVSGVSVVGGDGRLGFHARNEGGVTAAPWAEWAAHFVDLPSALPAFVPLPIGSATSARSAAARDGLITTLPWLLFGAAAVSIVSRLARHGLRQPGNLAAVTALVFALSATAAVAATWRMRGINPITAAPAQLELLRALGERRVIAFDLDARRRVSPDALVSRTRIELSVDRARAGARSGRPLVTLAAVPAGEYRVTMRHRGGDGWIMAGVGADRDPFALVTEPLAAFAAGQLLQLPVDVRTLIVRADDDAGQSVDGIDLQPLRLLRVDEKPVDGYARRAVRYTGVTAFFMDDRAFAEPNAFWVGGARDTTVVLLQDQPAASQPLLVRNAPVENRLSLTAGSWTQDLQLGPGEERRVDVPAAGGVAAVRIRSASGFRPSESDPGSRDTRFLGIYVRVP